MAERRMFAKTIIDSDAFIDMPLSSQALYFHLSMRADDEGFVNNPKKIQRCISCNDDDLKLLIAKNFIIPFESGIVVIKHWKLHNYIQSDRCKETVYHEEKKMLKVKDNKVYTLLDTDCIQNGYNPDTQVSIGKVSIGEVSLDEVSNTLSCGKQTNYSTIIDYLNSKAGTNYKHTSNKTKGFIDARINEGFTEDNFLTVIDKKCDEWIGTEQEKFIRPETLFGTKFEGYLNQKITKPKSGLGILKDLYEEEMRNEQSRND